MDRLSVYYRILGLEPGASLKEVKHAYRVLVKVWHPDRCFHDPPKQRRALENMQAINHAYAQLHALSSSSPPRLVCTKPNTRDVQRHPPSSPRRVIPIWVVPLVACLVLPLLFEVRPSTLWLDLNSVAHFFSRSQPSRDSQVLNNTQPKSHTPRSPVRDSPAPSKSAPGPSSTDHAVPWRSYFTVGSTMGDVLAIQGSPQWASEHVWEYDGSRVYFRDGRVTYWEVWPSSPLKAQLRSATMIHSVPAYFTVGSTKDDVLAVQGPPTRFTERVWEYGLSRVYFDGDRVLRWEEWSRDPLKVRLVPSTTPHATHDYFTVGSTKDEVLAVQGTPSSFSDHVWEYGLSRVYFINNRVSRWEEWRNSPLKAHPFPLSGTPWSAG